MKIVTRLQKVGTGKGKSAVPLLVNAPELEEVRGRWHAFSSPSLVQSATSAICNRKMICPCCDHDNLPGSDECGNCHLDLTQLDRPVAQDRVERSLMDDPVQLLLPRTPITLPPHATVGDAIEVMLQGDIGAVLIVEDSGALAGIFSERDLLMKVAGVCDDYAGRPVSEFMTRRPETVRASDSLALALHKMDCGGYRHLPVVNDGRLVGVVSVRDMLEHITRLCTRRGPGGQGDG
ncbi:MAG: CBS domain-containing protein [Gemmataceae bacterium]